MKWIISCKPRLLLTWSLRFVRTSSPRLVTMESLKKVCCSQAEGTALGATSTRDALVPMSKMATEGPAFARMASCNCSFLMRVVLLPEAPRRSLFRRDEGKQKTPERDIHDIGLA